MQKTFSVYGEKYPLLSFYLFWLTECLLSASSAVVRRPLTQHRRENSLKLSWQTLVEQAIISTAGKNSVRDSSCCLSFVIGVGCCQIGSWQHLHSSFFQVGIWESVKAVHPSPGSLAGKGAVRMGYEARMDLFAGADLLLADSTDLCGFAAVPEQAGNFWHYPWDESSPHPSLLPQPQTGFGLYPASGKNAHQNAGSVTKIAEALGETKHPFCFADCFRCAHHLCLNKPWKPGKQVNICTSHSLWESIMQHTRMKIYSPWLMLLLI